jgi:hypothetical protein
MQVEHRARDVIRTAALRNPRVRDPVAPVHDIVCPSSSEDPMRTTLLLVPATCLALAALTGCGDDRTPPPAAPDQGIKQPTNAAFKDAPSWVRNPTDDGKYKLASSGSARQSMGGESKQRTFAMNEARQEIARSISTEVKSMIETYFTQGGDPGAAEAAQQVQTEVSRNLTQALVNGSQKRAEWINDQTGDLYVWVVVDPDLAAQVAQQTAKATRAAAEKAQVKAELKAQDALDRLEKAVQEKLESQGGPAKALGK